MELPMRLSPASTIGELREFVKSENLQVDFDEGQRGRPSFERKATLCRGIAQALSKRVAAPSV